MDDLVESVGVDFPLEGGFVVKDRYCCCGCRYRGCIIQEMDRVVVGFHEGIVSCPRQLLVDDTVESDDIMRAHKRCRKGNEEVDITESRYMMTSK